MELPDVVKEKLIELDDENNQLRAEVKRLRASIVKKDEILNELEEENVQLLAAKQKISSANAKCAQLEQTIVSLRVTLEEKTRDSYKLMHEVETVTASLVSARSEIDELRRSSTPPSAGESLTVEPSNREEMMRMQEEEDDALFELQEAEKRILELETEREELIERVEVANAEARDVARHLKETRDQMHELEIELANFRTNLNIADRGTSMFAEVCSVLRDESDKYRADRDKLIEEKADLEVRVANVEKSVVHAQEDIETLKLQLAMMKEREQKKDAAKVSGMRSKGNRDQEQPARAAPNTAERLAEDEEDAQLNFSSSTALLNSTKESNRTASCWILFLRRFRKKKRCLPMNHHRVNKHHGLKKLRLADNSINDEEDHSRMASISASELRRIPRKQG